VENINDYPLAYDEIRKIITTRKSTEWEYIIEQVKKVYGKDISDTLPVFLKPSDFARDSLIFDAEVVFNGWYVFKKTPVLMINSFEDLEKVVGKNKSNLLKSISHFIE